MKRAISLLVALATASSMGVATFAADDTPGIATRSADTFTAATDDTLTSTDNDTFTFPNLMVEEGTVEGTFTVGAHELFLVANTDYVIGAETPLIPDKDYTFEIWINNSGDPLVTDANGRLVSAATTTRLTGAMVDGGTLRIRSVKGSSAITSAKIKTKGRGNTATYTMEIDTRANYGTKITDVEYNLVVTGQGATGAALAQINTSALAFKVGFPAISDDETDVGEDGYITITNDAPVIKKDQFTDIAKSANYKAINIEGEDGGWVYKGRVSGTKDSNFYFSYDVVSDLVEKFPDQEYKFLNFKGGVTFSAMGEMRIDVSDISDDFGTVYTYLYRNGKLTAIDTTYDSGTDEVVFRTNYLGTFVITDTEITDTTIIGEAEEPEEPEPEPEEPEPEEPAHGNPGTGANRAVNVAVTLGLVSLASAGAISRKKK